MSNILSKVEASLLRFLTTELEVALGISVLDDITSDDFEGLVEWVVIDSLSNSLSPQPKQNFFLHCAQQKGAQHAKQKLTALVDKVSELVEEGTQFNLYDFPNDVVIGHCEFSSASLSPVLQHRGGGSMRTLSTSVTYHE